MARSLAGTLTFPDGSPRPGTFTIVALINASGVARGAAIHVETDDQGAYATTLAINVYRVYFREATASAGLGDDLGVAKVIPDDDETSLLAVIAETAGYHPPDDPYHHNHHNDQPHTIVLATGGIAEAPIDGDPYARQDGSWSTVPASAAALGVRVIGKQNSLFDTYGLSTLPGPYTVTASDNNMMLIVGKSYQNYGDATVYVPEQTSAINPGFHFRLTQAINAAVVLTSKNPGGSFGGGDVFCYATDDGISTESAPSLRTGASAAVAHAYLLFQTETSSGLRRVWVVSGNVVAPEL